MALNLKGFKISRLQINEVRPKYVKHFDFVVGIVTVTLPPVNPKFRVCLAELI